MRSVPGRRTSSSGWLGETGGGRCRWFPRPWACSRIVHVPIHPFVQPRNTCWVPAVGQTCDGLEAGAGQSHPSVWGGVTCPLHPQGWPESWGMSGSLCSARSPAILPDIPRAWCGVSPTFPLSWLETPAFHPLPLIPTQHHLLNKEVGTLFPGSGYPGTFLLPPLGQDKGLLQNLGEEQPRASPNPRL